MRDKAMFALVATCWAVGLLVGAWFLVRSVDPSLLTRFATALIAAAVMLAARGVVWPRRIGYALSTVGLAWLLVLIGRSAVLSQFVGGGAGLSTTDIRAIPVALYVSFSLAMPVLMLILFIGRRSPSVLWVARKKR